MKNEVIVKGVTLTRAQLEEAWTEINNLEVLPLLPGTRFRWGTHGSRYLVLDPEHVLREAQRAVSERLTLLILLAADGTPAGAVTTTTSLHVRQQAKEITR